MLEFRIKQFLDQCTIISQQQSAFAVVVQTASGIHIRRKAEIVESLMSSLGRELTQDTKRFVEKDYHTDTIIKDGQR